MKKFLVLLTLCFSMAFAYAEDVVIDLNDYKNGNTISFPINTHNTHYNVSLINVEISTTKDPENITVEMKVVSVDTTKEFTVYRCNTAQEPEWLLPQGVNFWNWMTINDGILTFRDTYPTSLVKGDGHTDVVYKINDWYVHIHNVWDNEGIITSLTDIVADTLYNPIYINPQGMVSDKPWPGMNIVREGNQVYKAYMKE